MWGRLFLSGAIIIGTVRGGSGQTATADGVAALARGDYQRAVEILKPLAEDWRTDDTAAQFFMAGLYETGRGVSADPLRACALYQRAASNYDQPLGREASALLGASISRGLEFNQECQLLANVGFDHGFESVTFDLEAGHFVQWTLAAATVTYDGRTRRQDMGFGVPGARFLPVHHTELATGSMRALTRHFFEIFVWQPAGRSGPWTLYWWLFEVVRDEIIQIDIVDSLVTFDGDAPPSRDTFDVREYAVLRVDDEGNAEWAVLKEPRRQTQRIESDVERRELREAALARDAALKGVDWSRQYDVSRQPSTAYVDAERCGRMGIYAWTADRAEAVVVRAVAPDLDLWTQPNTMDLALQSVSISVETHVYAAPQRTFNFCSDVSTPPPPDSSGPGIWRAIAGTITIELTAPGVRARAPHLRRSTVTLSNVVLQNAAGATVRVAGPVRLTAIVG